MSTITIEARFCGPPGSGNGGYSAGLLAAEGDGPMQVTLRRPPPLDRPLRVVRGETLRALDGGHLVMEAVRAPLSLDVPAAPSWAAAERMAERYAGFEGHIFPTCFTCGPDREVGDGLRIFAGRAGSEGPVAAPWSPSATVVEGGVVRAPVVWAALDCPGYFAVATVGEKAVLGRMHARLDEPVAAAERCVAVGWPIDREGRKLRAGTAVFRARDGACLARALQTWITIAS